MSLLYRVLGIAGGSLFILALIGILWWRLDSAQEQVLLLEKQVAEQAKSIDTMNRANAVLQDSLVQWQELNQQMEVEIQGKKNALKAVKKDPAVSSWADMPIPASAYRLLNSAGSNGNSSGTAKDLASGKTDTGTAGNQNR